MKTKNLITYMIAAIFAIAFASCSKSSSSGSGSGSTATESSDAKTQDDDQTFYTNETDYATNDANAVLTSGGGSYNERPAGIQSPTIPSYLGGPCDTSSVVIDTLGGAHSITINYNGTGSCEAVFNHKRTGSIVISFSPGFKWGKEGDTLTITFNLTSVRISDGKTLVLTGTRKIVNTTGGLLIDLGPTLSSIVYSITDNTTVTFDDGLQRTWSTSLQRTYSYNSGNYEITTTGSLSGTNRFGDSFSADITSPLIVPECADFRYTSGTISYTGGAGGTSTTTFGYTDITGDLLDGCPLTLTTPLYYEFVWTGPNNGKVEAYGAY